LKEKLFVILKTKKYELNRHQDEYGAFTSNFVNFNDGQKAHNQFWNKYERPPKEEYWDYIIERRDLLVPQDVRERKGSFFTPKIWVEKSQKYLKIVLGEDWQEEYYIWDCAAGTGNLLAGLTNKYNIWAYAEAANKKTLSGIGANKIDIAVKTKVYKKYFNNLGISGRELFAQFLMRIYQELKGSIVADFSKLKIIQSPSFFEFRQFFQASIKKIFIVPSYTFDNVKGKFPIGFFIWDTKSKEIFKEVLANVYNDNGNFLNCKLLRSYHNEKSINNWLITTRKKTNEKKLAFMSCKGSDFQTVNLNFIVNRKDQLPHARGTWITDKNIIEASIYLSVRHCIKSTWLNDRDQFLHPNDNWKKDKKFQNDCLSFTLFSNNIQSKYGTNHWIPFSESEVNAKEKFESNFMVKFIQGKLKANGNGDLLGEEKVRTESLEFSDESKNVFNAGREIWIYYHTQLYCNVNASLYDIRAYFQGRNKNGRMNNKSKDEKYMNLIINLRGKLKILAKKIEPKIYDLQCCFFKNIKILGDFCLIETLEVKKKTSNVVFLKILKFSRFLFDRNIGG